MVYTFYRHDRHVSASLLPWQVDETLCTATKIKEKSHHIFYVNSHNANCFSTYRDKQGKYQ